MAKKDISKILTQGTPLKKMLLIAEDIARGKYLKDRILTDKEFNTLSNTFKKDKEIKIWNKFRRADETVSNAIVNLQGALFELKMNYSNLRGYILVWNSIENAELLVNSVLNEIKDTTERKRVSNLGAKGINLLFSKTTSDEEGYIDIKVDYKKDFFKGGNLENESEQTNERSLWYVMNNVKREITTSAIKWLSWEKALNDYIEETGFNVKTYKDKIQSMRDDVFTPIIGWQKYSGDISIGVDINPNIEMLLKDYEICPNIYELGIDESEYNFFKNEIIGDE